MGRKVGDTHVSRCDAFKHDVRETTAARSAPRYPKELIEFQRSFGEGFLLMIISTTSVLYLGNLFLVTRIGNLTAHVMDAAVTRVRIC